jgi:DNA-binding NtrC family response regulator
LVEREPIVLRVLTSALGQTGFEVLTARTGPSAQTLFHTYASHLCLAIVDIDRELSGVAFVQSLPNLTPRIPILYITELGDLEIEEIVPANYPVLHKPFSILQFLEAVAGAVESSEGDAVNQR